MSSTYIDGKMKLNQEKIHTEADDVGYGYNFNPEQELWMEGCADIYYPQTDCTWSKESVLISTPYNIIKYSKTNYTNVEAEDEDGNKLVICGMTAPYEGSDLDENHKKIHYLEKRTPGFDFEVELFDVKTLKKKIYKMSEVEEKNMSDYEIQNYIKDCPKIKPELYGIVLDDYVIKKDFGRWEIIEYVGKSNEMKIKNSFVYNGETIKANFSYNFKMADCVDTLIVPRDYVDSFPSNIIKQIQKIVVEPNNPRYDSRNGCNAVIETKTNVLVLGCQNTTIPNNIVGIADCAFHNCVGLKQILIPNSVKKIGYLAFGNCGSLTNISLPNGLTEISSRLFYECFALNTVLIPDSVTTIGNYAFYNCSSLETMKIPNSVKEIESACFANCYNLKQVILPDKLRKVERSLLYSCYSLKEIELPASIVRIDEYAFYDCKQVKKIIIPSGVTNIGKNNFYGITDCEIDYLGTKQKWIDINEESQFNHNVNCSDGILLNLDYIPIVGGNNDPF